MKKSTILFTVLAVAAFLVATVLGLQNPNIPENQNELPNSPESTKVTTISNNLSESDELNLNVSYSSLKT
ncbi:MAG: hypothetical protein ACOWW1_00270 [archaeon]|nr:hypothetical protein [Candidatus Bathyarchaeum sp.]